MKWLLSRLPHRDELLANRWMRPFARHLSEPNIWHFNRRSVARGVALGLFFGIIIPFAQTPVAAIFAVPARANLAVAALCTFVTNPLTTPAIYFGAYEAGRWLLRAQEHSAAIAAAPDDWMAKVLAWLADASLPTVTGLVLFSVTSAVLGYAAIHIGWRWWVSRRWTSRRNRAGAA